MVWFHLERRICSLGILRGLRIREFEFQVAVLKERHKISFIVLIAIYNYY